MAHFNEAKPFDFSFRNRSNQPTTDANLASDPNHLALLGFSDVMSVEDAENRSQLEEIRNAPLFTLNVRTAIQSQRVDVGQACVPQKDVFPQYGMIGHREPPKAGAPGEQKFKAERDIIYANMNAPWSAFICGSQGAGKSHTLSCLLENALLSPNAAGILPDPLTGVVFHYDRFTSHTTTQLCEAAYLCSAGVPVQVLVSPSNFYAMQTLYHNLPGLADNTKRPQVKALNLLENHLNVGNMKTLMNVDSDNAKQPLYLAVLDKILREMAQEKGGRPGFNYLDFKARLRNAGFTKSQLGPLGLRLQLLEEFLDQSRRSFEYEDLFNRKKGSLTIIDLSCPFVDENSACALFSICLSLFLERRDVGGRIIALDEAHKFLTKSGEAADFTERLVSIIRQQRHLASRVLISTQEPTLSPKLLELCNVAFVHRFRSPRWLVALKHHIAGAAKLQERGEDSLESLFKTIVSLRTGEALVFSPDSVLDVQNSTPGVWETEMSLEALRDRFVKVRIRNRISADGGKSIMAGDKMEVSAPKDFSRFVIDLTGDETRKEDTTSRLTRKASHELDFIPFTSSGYPMRKSRLQALLSPAPQDYRPQPSHHMPLRASTYDPPPGAAAKSNEAMELISAEIIETELVRQTEAIVSTNKRPPGDFKQIRRAAERELDLQTGALETNAWVKSSGEIIRQAAASWFRATGRAIPKGMKRW